MALSVAELQALAAQQKTAYVLSEQLTRIADALEDLVATLKADLQLEEK